VASTITNFSNAINVNYPIPGQDNDSQGFRTNFSNIQSSLTVAGDEISRLQVNAVNLNDTNDFGNNVVKRASFQACNQVVYNVPSGDIDGINIIIDYSNGNYQKIELNDSGTYSFNWKVGSYPTDSSLSKSIRLEVKRNDSNITLNFGGSNEMLSRADNTVTYKDPGICIWDVWTTDNETTKFATEIGGGVTVSSDGSLLYIPSGNGAPSETPTAIAGQIPMYFDTSSDYLYIYNGSWKKTGPFSV
jgi:hypothetical protein